MSPHGNAALFALIFVGVLLITVKDAGAVSARSPLECSGHNCPSDLRMNATFEQYRGRDYIWQIPEKPKGILLMIHGGFQYPYIYFDPGPRCRDCYGQPEERKVVLDALDGNYCVIAIKSDQNKWESWPLETPDHEIVTEVIVEWTKTHGLEKLPLFVWGHSSGGGFASTLPFTLPIRALILSCTGLSENAFELISPGHYPPTFFIYMNVTRAEVVTSSVISIPTQSGLPTMEDSLLSMAYLLKNGVPAVARPCFRRRVSPAFLLKQIRCLTDAMATGVYEMLAAEGLLDENDHLKENPVLGTWLVALRKWNIRGNILPKCGGADGTPFFLQSDVDEELTLAFGFHSFTSEWNNDVFEWLDSYVPSPADLALRSSSRATNFRGG